MDEEVALSVEEWAPQETRIIYEFVEDYRTMNQSDPEKYPLKAHPGFFDSLFRLWHDSCDAQTPEESWGVGKEKK